MINNKIYYCLFLVTILGALFFCFWNEYLLFITHLAPTQEHIHAVDKHTITLHAYHNDTWKKDEQEILWTQSTDKNAEHILNAWLIFLYDERIIKKKISLDSVLISQAHTAYVSTNNLIFSPEDSLFGKWMMIESLLTTLRENNLKIQHVQFLINHGYINDPHLDLSQPWPISGFKK